MAVLATDNFNRADNADLGANWSPGSFGTCAIFSNIARPSAVSAERREFWNAITWPNDQYSHVTILAVEQGGATGPGPAVRLASAALTGYVVYCDVSIHLYKLVAGAYTGLGVNNVPSPSPNDLIRVEAQGTTIRVFQNGVQAISVTDTSIASGNAGLGGYVSPITDGHMDDWEGGDFVAAGRTTRNTLAAPLGRHLGRGLWTHGGSS